jgi:hypothetical protein
VPVRLIGPPLKPTRHNGQLATGWAWLRDHCVYVLPIWEKGSPRLFPFGGGRRGRHLVPADITFGAGGEWRDLRYGPALHFADAGFVNTNYTRIGSVGLFAAATEQWTVALRFRTSDQATDGSLIARGSGTTANRTFMAQMNRIGNAASTPRFDVRGSTTNTSWSLDDDEYHTIWVTWNGTVMKAYYDAAQGETTLAVGAAVEETTQNIMLGARTQSGPSTFLTGDIDFCAILDCALSPAAIVQWHRDLYAPWRPARRNKPQVPVLPQTDKLVYPQEEGVRVRRLELWTDDELNGGTLLGPITKYSNLDESVTLDGDHTITFTVPMTHPIVRMTNTDPDVPNLRVDQVVRMVLSNGDYSNHRIEEPIRENKQGKRTRTIIANSIFHDLTLRGTVRRVEADGSTSVSFEALGLTLAEQVQRYVIPALNEAHSDMWIVGDMAHNLPVDMTYDIDTPLAALLRLADTSDPSLELQVERTDAGYKLNLVYQVGAGAKPLIVRARKNLTELGFRERSADQATRVYAFGEAAEGRKPTVGDAIWVASSPVVVAGGYQITLRDPAGGTGPLRFSGQFLPQVDVDPLYWLEYLSSDYRWPIVSTDAATQTFVVNAPVAPPSSGTQRVRIVADSESPRKILFVDHPEMITRYGVRVAHLERPDIPATDNLTRNALMRDWPSGSLYPNGWVWDAFGGSPNAPIVTRETDPKYWANGGQAMRVYWPNPNGFSGAVYTPVATIPLRAQGPVSWFIRVTTITGEVQAHLVVIRRELGFDGVTPTPYFPYATGLSKQYITPLNSGQFAAEENDQVLPMITNRYQNVSEDLGKESAWDLSRYPLYGGIAYIALVPNWNQVPPGTECVIEAAQITLSPRQLPLLDGNGGVRLHQAANQRVGLYSSPAPVISVNLVDLAFAGGMRFPYPQLKIGAPITVVDPDSDLNSITTRIVGWSRNWSRRSMAQVELSNQRKDITRLMAKRPRAPRHQIATFPDRSRGTTFAPV